jgi:hypothetical protein
LSRYCAFVIRDNRIVRTLILSCYTVCWRRLGGIVEFDMSFEDDEERLTVDLTRIPSEASFVCLLHQLPMS